MRINHGWMAGVFGVSILALLAPQASAGDAPAATASRPAVETTRPSGQSYQTLQERPDRLIAVLPNRLIVIAQELRTAPVVSAQVWVKTGSVFEQEHTGAGLSHFLEHLLSGGSTATRSEEESNTILGSIGAQVNASTSLDNVRYYINTTSDRAADAVELLSDWMQHNQIKQEEYARERDVIQREFDMGNGEPARILWKLTEQARYNYHPARHPTIGYIDEFLSISRDEIYNFYKRMYVPNNTVFVVAGDIDKRKIVEQVARLWGGAAPQPLPTLSLPIEPEPTAQRSVTGNADMDKPRLRLAWPGTRLAGEGDYALDLLSVLMGQGEASRLTRTVRDEARVVNTISAYNVSYVWGEGFFGIDAEIAVPKPTGDKPQEALTAEAVERARKAILEQVEKVRNEGVTTEELARAKRQVMARVVYETQSAEATADRLAEDVISTGDPDYLRRYTEAIERITPDAVNAAAARFLAPGRLIAVTLLPQPKGQKTPPMARPPEEKGGDQVRREPWELDNLTLIKRMAKSFETPAANAQPVRLDPIQRYVLPNGLRLLVQRSTLVPAVAMQMYQLGGLLADQPGLEGLANAATTMLPKGTTTRSAQEIARQVEDIGADLETQCGNNSIITRAVSLRQDWQTVLGLLADVTLRPSFPEDEWAKVRPRLVAAIGRQNDNWSGELRSKFREAYFGDHTWSQSPLGRANVVDTLKANDLRDFYQRHLGASHSVLVVFGDVDPEEVRKQAEQLFADLPGKAVEAVEVRDPKPPTAKVLLVKTNKPLAAVQIGFGPVGTRQSPDYAAVEVLSHVMSSFPTGWLDQELRGRGPGLVYAVGAGPFTGFVPGYFALLFNTTPAKVPEAVSRSMSVVERAKNTLVDGDDLTRAKASVLTDEFFHKQTNTDRAADAALNELYGLGEDEPAQFLKRVKELTPEMLQAVAQLYLRNPVVVVLSHEAVSEEELQKAVAGGAK